MPPFVTYSLLAVCVAALVFGIWVAGREQPSWAKRISRRSGLLQIGAVVGAYLLLRPGSGDEGLDAMATARAQNRPIFIDLYSNF